MGAGLKIVKENQKYIVNYKDKVYFGNKILVDINMDKIKDERDFEIRLEGQLKHNKNEIELEIEIKLMKKSIYFQI